MKPNTRLRCSDSNSENAAITCSSVADMNRYRYEENRVRANQPSVNRTENKPAVSARTTAFRANTEYRQGANSPSSPDGYKVNVSPARKVTRLLEKSVGEGKKVENARRDADKPSVLRGEKPMRTVT